MELSAVEVEAAKVAAELAMEEAIGRLLSEFVNKTGKPLKWVHFEVLVGNDKVLPPYVAVVEMVL